MQCMLCFLTLCVYTGCNAMHVVFSYNNYVFTQAAMQCMLCFLTLCVYTGCNAWGEIAWVMYVVYFCTVL